MRRSILILATTLALVIGAVSGASAASFKFRSAGFDRGGSLTFSGVAVGLGNSDYSIDLEGTALVQAMCENKGGHQAAGRNALSVTASNTETIMTDSNGQTPVSVTVEDPTLDSFPVSPSEKEAGCPNGNWTVVDVSVIDWVAATVTVTDLTAGEVVVDQDYTCGTVGEVFSCTEV